MRFPPAPAPCANRITAVGTLSKDDRSTGPLDCLIDVSNVAAHGIVGWVLGNRETRAQIEKAHGRGGAMRLQASTGSETVTSDSVWIGRTQSFGASAEEMPHGLLGIASEFRCLDLTRRFERKSDKPTKREVRFLLRGPRVAGLVGWMHSYSFEGSNEVRVYKSPLATGGGLPFSMFVLPHFFHDIGGRERERGVLDEDIASADARTTSETDMLALACRTAKRPEDYDDERFLNEGRRAVEDMCLMLSLLAGGMITWHAFYLSGAGHSLQHNRSLSDSVNAARNEEIVDRSHQREFLRTAFRRLRRLREDGIDLEMPIVYAIAGGQARVAWQRFGEFFLALEALHSIHLEGRGKTFLVRDKAFKRVQSRLKKPLGTALHAEGECSRRIRRQMEEKLIELNRPALWRGVQALMKRLRVDWEDLYLDPTPERPTFLKLRNSLFHSHKSTDDESVLKESVRLEAVVHRILLRWLGWESLWDAPPPWVRHYGAGKSLPDRHRLDGRSRRKRKRR